MLSCLTVSLCSSFLFLLAHLLLAGSNSSSLYSWRSDVSLFSLVLRSSPAISFLSLPVPYLNNTKTLLATTEEAGSTVYEFTSVSNQSDFIPRYGFCCFTGQGSNDGIAYRHFTLSKAIPVEIKKNDRERKLCDNATF